MSTTYKKISELTKKNSGLVDADYLTGVDTSNNQNVNLKNIVLLDNSMYSFASQINNGILINTFINDKSDNELYNALEYLIKYIYPAEDVRDINERFFNFRQIMNDIIN